MTATCWSVWLPTWSNHRLNDNCKKNAGPTVNTNSSSDIDLYWFILIYIDLYWFINQSMLFNVSYSCFLVGRLLLSLSTISSDDLGQRTARPFSMCFLLWSSPERDKNQQRSAKKWNSEMKMEGHMYVNAWNMLVYSVFQFYDVGMHLHRIDMICQCACSTLAKMD